jgi:antitoxin CcdA
MRMIDAHLGIDYTAHMGDVSDPRSKGRPLPKRATNVSVRSDLLEAAREVGLNLSATLERALVEELANVKRARWREENGDAIAAYNEYVDAQGVFSDGLRTF